MRSIPIVSMFLVACTSATPPAGAPAFVSVRDRLDRSPTRLLVMPTAGAGSLTASRYGSDGWQQGTATLSIGNGEVVATVDPAGQVELSKLEANVDPIEIPSNVFGKPARLTDLRIALAAQPRLLTTWTDDDNAIATAMIDVDASWSIAFDTTVLPLAQQHLPPLPVELTLGGDGDRVEATLALHGSGELWSWAGLVKLTDLQLVLDASTNE